MAPKAKAAAGPALAGSIPEGAGRTLATIVTFSLLMVTCPLALYFSSFYGYFDGLYSLTIGIPPPEQRTVASAILAVVGVNLVVGGFIFVAFREVNDDGAKVKASAKKND
ncbi:hypothetical protein Agub_g323 [Astrephomene gubernaculifera]|uniref:Vacuolar ATPase assembly integral membrane protein VMA21 homolog n=1 Tax=Astrephomene gubernaculifera TaxID=47775 RepID=A0AAD3HFX8_9CHLO|nr:hypothetical protein Agub_g323 [Astrephomene gubernaculifera]